MTSSGKPDLESILYPKGTQFDEQDKLSVLMEEYKLFVETSERLVARRQNVNTFFLSVNALLLSAIGLIIKEAITTRLATWGIFPISIAGILLCIAWRRLVLSLSQLNAGKFAVIHLIEKYLPASLFIAEWKALGEGEDKEKYVPSTKTESFIPVVFITLYAAAFLCGLVYLIVSN